MENANNIQPKGLLAWLQSTIVYLVFLVIGVFLISIALDPAQLYGKRIGSAIFAFSFLFAPFVPIFIKGMGSRNKLQKSAGLAGGLLWVGVTLSFLVSFFPSFSPAIFLIGMALTIILILTLIGKILSGNNLWLNWFASFVFNFIFTLVILGFAIRSWSALLPYSSGWLFPLLTAYLIAMLLPVIKPDLSVFLFREQFAPQTSLGKLILRWSLAILPTMGVTGAGIGMLLSSSSNFPSIYLLVAIISTLVLTFGTQALMHGLWRARPTTSLNQ